MNAFVDFFLTIRNSKFFNGLVIFVIIASALYAGISSYDIPAEYLYYLLLFDYSITVFFLIELVIRMVAERNLGKFFKDGWNIFDSVIVVSSLIPTAGTSVMVLRLLRLARLLRVISFIPELRFVIEALIESLKKSVYVLILIFILLQLLIYVILIYQELMKNMLILMERNVVLFKKIKREKNNL